MFKLVLLAAVLVLAANAQDGFIGMPTPSKLLWAGGVNQDSEFSLLSDPAGDARREFYCFYVSSANYETKATRRLLISDIEAGLCDRLVVNVDSIEFDPENNFALSFKNLTVRNMVMNGLNDLKMANPSLKVFLNPQFNISRSFFDQIRANNADYYMIARNFVRFLITARVNGIMLYADHSVNVERAEIDQFFWALRNEARNLNLWVLLYVAPFENSISAAFKYVDRILLDDQPSVLLNDSVLRHTTALRRRINDKGLDIMLNKDFQLDYVVRMLGAPRDKVIMVINSGGYDFELKDSRRTWIGASSKGRALYLEYISINEICDRQKSEDWKLDYDRAQRVPYMNNGTIWTALDNKESLRHKLNMVKHKRLRGVFLYSIDYDDVTGEFCEDVPFAITKFVKKNLLPCDDESEH